MSIQKLSVFTAVILFLCVSLAYGQDKEEYIKKGDEFYDKWDNRSALIEYTKAYKIDSTDYEILCKMSRAYTDLGEKLDEKIRETYYQKGMDFAEKAVIADPDGPDGHFWKAVVLGRLALFKGGKTKIELSKGVKTEIDIVKQLDPEYDLAYYVIGRWHREIANLSRLLKLAAKVIYGGVPEASNEKAIENFQKAIELDPERIEYRLELGRTYMMLKKWEQAREQFLKCGELASAHEDDDDYKIEAKELFEKIKKKK